jgi:hypothetical protein
LPGRILNRDSGIVKGDAPSRQQKNPSGVSLLQRTQKTAARMAAYLTRSRSEMEAGMRIVMCVLAALMLWSAPIRAEALSAEDQAAFQSIITGQIEAFRAENGAKAYSYAAPMIRQIFPSPEQFMNMVRQGYQPVYRPQSFQFGEAGFSASGRPIQRVKVVGPDGITYEAIYTMERQPDGSWAINGCAIVRIPDLGA